MTVAKLLDANGFRRAKRAMGDGGARVYTSADSSRMGQSAPLSRKLFVHGTFLAVELRIASSPCAQLV